MAKFRYSLQNILNIKEKMETQAKQEFGMAPVSYTHLTLPTTPYV